MNMIPYSYKAAIDLYGKILGLKQFNSAQSTDGTCIVNMKNYVQRKTL